MRRAPKAKDIDSDSRDGHDDDGSQDDDRENFQAEPSQHLMMFEHRHHRGNEEEQHFRKEPVGAAPYAEKAELPAGEQAVDDEQAHHAARDRQDAGARQSFAN